MLVYETRGIVDLVMYDQIQILLAGMSFDFGVGKFLRHCDVRLCEAINFGEAGGQEGCVVAASQMLKAIERLASQISRRGTVEEAAEACERQR